MSISIVDRSVRGSLTFRGRKLALLHGAVLSLLVCARVSSADIIVPIGDTYSPPAGSIVSDDLLLNGGTADIGGSTFLGTVNLGADSTIKASSAAAAIISGSIVGTGGFEKTGSNKLTLAGANSYEGTTVITGGVLDVATGGTLGTGAVVNNALLTFSGSDSLVVTSNISGVGAITKGGLGNLTLAGASTYTGTMTVGNGTVFVEGSVTGTTIVGAGAAVGGSGSTGALTLLTGAIISPGGVGSEFATLNASSISWASNSIDAGLFFDLRSNVANSDMLAVSDAFNRSSNTSSINYLVDFKGTGVGGRTYTLVTWGSTNFTESWLDNFVAVNLKDGLEGYFQFNENSLQFVVVPEPATVGMAFGLFGAVVIAARRIRRWRTSQVDPDGGSPRSTSRGLLRKGCTGALVAVMGVHAASAATVVFTLETASFEDIQKAMDAGALTSVELMTMYLNRRDVYDQAGMKLNSVVAISPTLFADAAASDARRTADALLSPLDGIPFVTKDSYNTAGMATTGGIAGWVDMVATEDCPVVDKLRDAGAILLGHANMDRFATSAGNTVSEPYGATLNAYTLGVPAGSSGGPAVAAGANFAGFGFGGETGGSIRNPSDRAGVVGYKVGVGTVPIGGILALVPDRDVIGPMARYTKDSAKVMDVAAFDEPTDIWATVDYTPGRPKASDFLTTAETTSLAGKRIGVVGTYVGIARPEPAPTPIEVPSLPTNIGSSGNTTNVSTPNGEIGAIFDRAKTELEAMGATVVTVFLPPNVDTAVPVGDGMPTRALYTGTNGTFAQAYAHKAFLEGLGQDPVVRLTQAGRATSLINAVANNTTLSFTSEPALEHFSAQAIINRRFEAWMDAEDLDALVWPTHITKTRTGGSNPGRDLINNIGLPCVTVPMGVIPSTGEPITLAFVGRYRGDADMLAYASAYETGTNYRIPSPLAPPLEGETIVYTVPDGMFAPLSTESDSLGPVVSIGSKAGLSGSGKKSRLTIEGTATDTSGIQSLKIFINGKKVSAKAGRKWLASLPVSELKKLVKAKDKTVEVTVLAKDSRGNASATRKPLKVAALLAED